RRPEHLASLDEGRELPLGHEAVVPPVDLAGPRGPSGRGDGQPDLGIAGADRCGGGARAHGGGPGQNGDRGRRLLGAGPGGGIAHSAKCATSFSAWWRSEEHTSELQSRFDLVCRLLLEK